MEEDMINVYIRKLQGSKKLIENNWTGLFSAEFIDWITNIEDILKKHDKVYNYDILPCIEKTKMICQEYNFEEETGNTRGTHTKILKKQ